jgi:ribosomal-protein-alanine N-acetyltransferase
MTPAFDQATLQTPRLLLRPLCEADAPAVFATYSDARVGRYLSRPPWRSIEQAHEMIARDRKALPVGEYLRLGLQRVADGELVGDCCLFNIHQASRRAELGYALNGAYWGQGYMVEALTALLDLAFGPLGFNRLEADIDPRNTPSARSVERLGFRREGHLRQRWIVAGEMSDSWLYGLLADEWRLQPR